MGIRTNETKESKGTSKLGPIDCWYVQKTTYTSVGSDDCRLDQKSIRNNITDKKQGNTQGFGTENNR